MFEIAEEGLAAMPSAEVVTSLAGLDVASLDRDQALDALVAWTRVASWVQAHIFRVLAALDGAGASGIETVPEAADKQWVREEVACALGISSELAAAKLAEAREVVTRLPGAFASLSAGELDGFRVRVIAEATAPLNDAEATAVEARVLPRAGMQSLTALRRSLQRAVLALAPGTVEQVRRRNLAARTVRIRPAGIDMCELWALLPADGAAAVMAALDTVAGRAAPDERTVEQRRADALVQVGQDVLACRPPARQVSRARGSEPREGLRPGVQVTVALSTLLGLDSQAGELEGVGPISAELARAIAHDPTGTWRRLVTDPHGQLLDYGRRTYRPPTALARHVVARDRTCRFPSCRRPAARCELDHIIEWNAGAGTSPTNLQALCRRHHHAKHDAGWRVTRDDSGTTTWTSPTGRTYTQAPETYPLDTTTTGASVRDGGATTSGTDPPPQ